MSTGTLGAASPARPKDVPPRVQGVTTAERRVRALAPTVFCPSTDVEQCVQRASERTTP